MRHDAQGARHRGTQQSEAFVEELMQSVGAITYQLDRIRRTGTTAVQRRLNSEIQGFARLIEIFADAVERHFLGPTARTNEHRSDEHDQADIDAQNEVERNGRPSAKNDNAEEASVMKKYRMTDEQVGDFLKDIAKRLQDLDRDLNKVCMVNQEACDLVNGLELDTHDSAKKIDALGDKILKPIIDKLNQETEAADREFENSRSSSPSM